MAISGKDKKTLTFLGGFLIIALVYVKGIEPLTRKVYTLKESIQTAGKKVSQLQKAKDREKLYRKKMKVLKDDLKKLALRYPYLVKTGKGSNELSPALLKTIERYAAKTGVTIQMLRPLSPEKVVLGEKFECEKSSIGLNFQSGYSNLVDFIYAIENSKYFLTIESLDISPGIQDKSSMKVTMLVNNYKIP